MEKKANAGKAYRNRSKIALAALIEIAVLVFCYYATFLHWYGQIAIALLSLFAVGVEIRKLGDFQGWNFVYLIGGRRGLDSIDRTSKKYRTFWNQMAIWGFVLSFGILSYPMLGKKFGWKPYVFGLLSLIAITLFVFPYLSLAIPFIHIPQLQAAVSSVSSSTASGVDWLGIAFDGVTVAAGFAGYVFFAIFYNALSILNGIATFVAGALVGVSQTSALTSQIPGVAPVIPGIDIPFLAGIMSLAFLLIIHEFSHGILAREAKVKLKSIGLVLLGIIPIGAFVEPDEKEVAKLDAFKQTKILSAGISANFVAMVVFFALTALLFYYVLPGITQNLGVFVSSTTAGYPAYNVISIGSQVLYWNGYSIKNISDLDAASKTDLPGSKVSIVTSNGTYSLTAVAVNGSSRGLVGVELVQKEQIYKTFYGGFMYFLYTLFALSFLLNFLVGAVNLLPLPGFDGWRIYQVNIRNQRIVRYLAAFILICLVVNVLPWLFYL